MSENTDCLVLKIEEYDIDTKELDTTMYILYDKKEHYFVVRGQRFSKNIASCVYSFKCEFAEDLADFISFVICKKNQWSYTLYNYDNLPHTSDEVSYDFLKSHDSRVYELSGYDRQKFKRTDLIKRLRMLRNVFNYYN
jgi:hypothetical protein